MNLFEKLEEYGKRDYYPFHMPGHKRNISLLEAGNPYKIDITEIDGFDNLHEPEDILKEEMEKAARLFGSEETYFLINGSSCGLLAAISACTTHQDEIIIARNCHKSVYHGVLINELTPFYIYPQREDKFGINLGILPEDVDNSLKEHPKAKAVVLVSPTYEGIVSDIQRIAAIVHSYGKILIVDEAHGAHFPFHSEFPKSAIGCGADIVIQSIHKTLPAFTQTALLHVQGERVNRGRLGRFLSVFQSTSPSYVLMAGISRCMEFLEKDGEACFDKYVKTLKNLYQEAENLCRISLLDSVSGFERDISKLVVSVKNTSMTGRRFYDILLQRYHLQMEMAQDTYVLAMTSVFDTVEGFGRLFSALLEIDKELFDRTEDREKGRGFWQKELLFTPYEASLMESIKVPFDRAIGKAAAGYIYLYPPGIPLLCPGERIDKESLEEILYYKRKGLRVHGITEENGIFISVIAEERAG